MLIHDLLRDIDSGMPSSAVLDNIYEVEDLLIVLSEIDKKVGHLKGLREYRVKSIDAEITKQNNRVAQIRDLILRSLKQLEPNQKTFQFPDVGKVTRKNVAGTYEIEDEAAFLEDLKKLELRDQVVETKEVVNKREAKKLAAELSKQGKMPAGVTLKDSSETISITFDDKATKQVDAQPASPVSARRTLNDLDALEV